MLPLISFLIFSLDRSVLRPLCLLSPQVIRSTCIFRCHLYSRSSRIYVTNPQPLLRASERWIQLSGWQFHLGCQGHSNSARPKQNLAASSLNWPSRGVPSAVRKLIPVQEHKPETWESSPTLSASVFLPSPWVPCSPLCDFASWLYPSSSGSVLITTYSLSVTSPSAWVFALVSVPLSCSVLAPGVAFSTFKSLMFKMLQWLFKTLWRRWKSLTWLMRPPSPRSVPAPSHSHLLALSSPSFSPFLKPGFHSLVLSGQDRS